MLLPLDFIKILGRMLLLTKEKYRKGIFMITARRSKAKFVYPGFVRRKP